MKRPARVLYLGPPASAQSRDSASVAELMIRTGRNTGNLLIGDAIQRHLKAGDETFQTVDSLLQQAGEPLTARRTARLDRLDTRFIESSFDVIVIGAANFLFERFDFGNWADFLESINLRCVIIGLGAQAPSYDSPVTVHEGTRRMVHIIAERSATLGVRGEFTASVLNDMGIRNVRLIGCPSMYWTCQPELHFKPRVECELSVSVNGSANVVQHAVDVEAARKVEALIARSAFEHGYTYILQAEAELMEVLRDAPADVARIEPLMKQYGLASESPETFLRFARQQMKVYWNTGEWLAAITKLDFVMGTRFHGCLIGVLGGVPSFVFVHDARTRELCEMLNIPRVDVRDVRKIDVEVLYESLDLRPMEATYADLYRNYVEFLDENGLPHRLSRQSA
jgi:hypothetical protein